MYIFESFRNAVLFLGFGTGFLGFEDVFLTYDRTIGLPDLMPQMGDTSITHNKQQQGSKQHRDFQFEPFLPEAASRITL